MPIARLMCRNTKTGATAEIAELTLPHIPDWVPIDQLTNDQSAGGEAIEQGAPADPDASGEPEPKAAAAKKPKPDEK